MPSYSVDSSALVERYRIEPGSQGLLELLKIADQLLVSRLAVVEVSAALVRRPSPGPFCPGSSKGHFSNLAHFSLLHFVAKVVGMVQ